MLLPVSQIPQTNERNISTNGSRCIRTGYKKDKTSLAIRQDSIQTEQRTVKERQRNCLPLNIPVFWDVTLCKSVQRPRKSALLQNVRKVKPTTQP
jgi:hypothetical protein